MAPNLPPYQRRDETLLERCARLRAEYAAAGLAWGRVGVAANENVAERERERPRFYWEDRD